MFSLSLVGGPNPRRGVQICERIWTGGSITPYPLEDLDRGGPNLGSYIVVVAARWTKSLKFTLSIAVHRGGLAKNIFFFDAKKVKRVLNPFHGKKIK